MNNLENLNFIKRQLDAISPGFCLAKWTQVTLHLASGQTHSCHHPPTHKIPLDEIEIDVSALHNTRYKKDRRKEMLFGIRPSECKYCWAVEDMNSPNTFSDRILKSAESWSYSYFDEVMEKKWDKNIKPKYLEISFSSVCNFKCSYCTPAVSSKWMEEIEKYGPYDTHLQFNNLELLNRQGRIPIKTSEHNPYVDAFWKWLPEIYNDLHVLRITGGEPLLDKNIFKILDFVLNNPNPKLDLSINSNLCVPDELYDNFLNKIALIISNKCVKDFHLYTSNEAHGEHAEYIRYGLNYNKWLENCKKFINNVSKSSLMVMSTYNALSVSSFKLFLQDCLELAKMSWSKHQEKNCYSIFRIDIPHLVYPGHQAITILNEDFEKYFIEQIGFLKNNLTEDKFKHAGFDATELLKLERVYSTFKENLNKQIVPKLNIFRKDFKIFIDEHDRRRNINFLRTFPDYTNFYKLCESLS